MDNRLENLRMFFPAEVTGSYLAIQGLLSANGIQKTEYMWYMVFVVLALAAINILIYLKFYGTTSLPWLVVIAVGFIIWAGNIDMARFKDLPYLGETIEIMAPTLLILYTLISSFFEFPKKKGTGNAPIP